jgi:protein-disulfide isomerase
MSHRAEQKAAAREARLEAERADAARAARKRRLSILGALAALAIAVVVVALVLSGGDEEESAAPGQEASLYAGIPQDGDWLGDPDAPVVLEEYADLQCPFCRQYSEEVLPELVRDYVRTGKVRMRLRLMTFLGDDSVRGAQAAWAAAAQDGMWQFADEFYREQGPENSGYADDDFLRATAEAAGLDPDAVLDGRGDPKIDEELAAVQRDAERNGVDSTPSFLVGPKGGELVPLQYTELSPEQFRDVLDREVADAGGEGAS